MPWSQSLCFALASAVNGALVGVAGPSLHALAVDTGLGTAALGRAVFLNRLAKLVGSFVWAAYARHLEKGSARITPRFVLFVNVGIISMSTLAVANLRALLTFASEFQAARIIVD